MTRETFVGFDSAWTDRNLGGLAIAEFVDGKLNSFLPPHCVTFDEAITTITQHANHSGMLLMAIDQPTIVPNLSGSRPVERVARSVMSAYKSAVQPASRSRVGMFDSSAPIWRFLDAIGGAQSPCLARTATHGIFVLEVYPALALCSLIDEVTARRRAAKYNPTRKTFQRTDWQLLARSCSALAAEFGIQPLAEWFSAIETVNRPRKADQDKVDSAVCLMIAVMWRRAERQRLITVGDRFHGYMVSPVAPAIRERLQNAGARFGVPIDVEW